MSRIIIVEESPQDIAVGEAIAYIFDFKDVGAADPTAAGTTLCYDQNGVDVSSTVLSSATSLTGARVTAKVFTPASAQQYTLLQPATVDGNTVYLACRFNAFVVKDAI